MSFYCFETRQDRTLAPYPPPEFSQQIEKMTPSEIVDHIINTNIDKHTLLKIEKAIAVPLRQLISPRENRRRRCIPRPQNNFVLYRRNFHAVITKERGHGVAKDFKLISNEAAKHWSEESNEIKQLYELIADCAKKVHDCTYPQYVYQPKHKTNKKGGNGTIFREVTLDSCSKKNGEKNKEGKDSKDKEDSKRDKITMTKSFVSTTFISADVNAPATVPPGFTTMTNFTNMNAADLATNSKDKREWRWAHYSQNKGNTANAANAANTLNVVNTANSAANSAAISKNNTTNNTSTLKSTHLPLQAELLPPIDIPISSNFLASYDRNIWSMVNGLTNL